MSTARRDAGHQHRRITYSVADKGTFVHPDALDLLRCVVLREPSDNPDLQHRVAAYLTDQQAITLRYHHAPTANDKNAALHDLLHHADTNNLIDQVITYQADHGNLDQQPEHLQQASDSGQTPPPAKRPHSSRNRAPKQ